MTPEATQMSGAGPGVTFRETMSGGFALGETDPKVGKDKGEDGGNVLALHATINIRDLEKFVSEPGHAGDITGSVDYAPLGVGMPSKSGKFSLFSPTNDPKTKYMVYELGFQSGGKDYYLAGRKEVRDDRGIDFWTDVTTLFTRLHDGPSDAGPVVGAGTLKLSLKQLKDLSKTVQVTNANSLGEKTKTLALFTKFFLGEMWETYISDKF